MIKGKSNRKGGWQLVGAPKGALLRRLSITFPEIKSHAGGKTTNHIGGTEVSARIQYASGKIEILKGVEIQW